VIHSGSELSITKPAPFTKKAVTFIQKVREQGVAQFGICYGHQLICLALVGKHAVRSSSNGFEVGWRTINFTRRAQQIFGIGESEAVWQHHFDEVIELPEGSELLATNAHTEIQAYINDEQRIVGTQFHPEFDKEAGDKLFLRDRELLEKNNYDVDEIITRGPSIEAGRIFFGYFLLQAV
jgi:GMP synthase (glutamine-hydrolysing)